MGNQASACCQQPCDKYEVHTVVKGARGAEDASGCSVVTTAASEQQKKGLSIDKSAPVAVERPAAQAHTAASGDEDKGGAFCTTDPLQVSAELAPLAGLPYQFHECGPPPPPCDDLRLRTVAALSTCGVSLDVDQVDAPPDPEIASILKLVQSIFEAPAALVALFGDRRIFIRDAEGAFKRGDFPWRWSFCGWTMASKNDQTMVIPDATKDARFCNNEMVKSGPGVRFYCGTPLIASNGQRLGTLCFADVRPREFDASRYCVLNNLAELVVRHLEKDIALQLRAHDNNSLVAAYGNLRRTLDCFDHCVALLDTGSEGWRILFVNDPCCKALGVERESLLGGFLSQLLAAADGALLPTGKHQAAADSGRGFHVTARFSPHLELQLRNKGEEAGKQAPGERRFVLTFRPASRKELDKGSISIGVPSFITATPLRSGEDVAAERAAAGEDNEQQMQSVHRRPDQLYFMLLQDAAQLEAERAAAAAKAAADAQALSLSTHLSTHQSSVVSSTLSTYDKELSQPPEAISGLIMGHLLGKGSYGSVYAGTWFGSAVAVKIIDEDLNSDASAPPIEALLSKELRHPHIVATLRCARRVIGAAGVSRTPSAAHSAATTSRSVATLGGRKLGSPDGSTGAFSDDTANAAASKGDSGGFAVGSGCAAELCGSGGSGVGASGGLVPVFMPSGLKPGGSTGSGRGGGIRSAGHASQAAGPGSSASHATWQAATGSIGSASHAAPSSQAGWAVGGGSAGGAGGCGQGSRGECEVTDEAYDDFDDVGRDSALSPFMMAPGSQPPQSGLGPALRGGGPKGAVGDQWQTEEGCPLRHQTWLVLEYCDRGTLQDAIDRGWLRVSPAVISSGPRMEAVVSTAVEIASALSFLHAKDIVHGDLSAWNVMLCTSGPTASAGGRGFVAKVADFGLARHLDIRTKIQTRTYGTLTHMPAETLRDGVISKAVDVYSFGVLLWQLYTSSRPWAGLRHGQIIVMVVTQSAKLRFPPGCPPAYEALAMACMAADPKDRPPIKSVLAELEVMKAEVVQ
ncbi:Mitogen-activated protein kinase kinase kinase 13-A [Tetrabaena socialis]|uniref:Mitogen-activated protein kinase kinase kinase 13-A n=1 Tax=Tetrabaena socialis TaxID=47790 RepID=A0A2J8AFX2_9CHLO|nr:Mitogen-activated protein kinase kinase kinase 13-A [Tetrabaena socialis]|eukprot:PNH11410.1 Mitogen-activated protein kinase kinase kinase 13-A [Tetrabaena socialis]